MMKAAEAKDCGPLGELASRVGKAINEALDLVMTENPDLEVVFVVVPGIVPGGAVLSARKLETNSMEVAMQQMERSQKILRDGADSCGRALFRSPGEPIEVAAESAFIIRESAGVLESWNGRKCNHPEHGVREAAVMIASGVRILAQLGAPNSVLVDLTRICKEACRRAHLAIASKQAEKHAQA